MVGGQVFEHYGARVTFVGCAVTSGVLLIFYISVQLCFIVRDMRQDKKRDMEERAKGKWNWHGWMQMVLRKNIYTSGAGKI